MSLPAPGSRPRPSAASAPSSTPRLRLRTRARCRLDGRQKLRHARVEQAAEAALAGHAVGFLLPGLRDLETRASTYLETESLSGPRCGAPPKRNLTAY